MEPSTEAYFKTLPNKVLCANNFKDGALCCPTLLALAYKHIQLNNPWEKHFLAFDIDRHDAALAAEDSDLPVPTFTMINPANGHGHLLYQLSEPILDGPKAKKAPLEFYRDVDAAITIQLDADKAFNKTWFIRLKRTSFHEGHRFSV